ncbi:MAG: 16S rRNA (cytosine(1402)-N(4))-methyltransferase RsmH [Candidatus Pacebacteria bacterium]|nr:16S rRNA (cytosine(1402)-N(4))-methyltransferase RsmH [Candidatus Paceibacterota bacterium]
MAHISVLCKEIVEFLDARPGQVFLDGTVGNGGHASVFAPLLGKHGIYIGLDRDSASIKRAQEVLVKTPLKKLLLHKEDFRHLDRVLHEESIESVDRILFDLGFNSDQLELSGRGFSFLKDEPLLMTYENDPNVSDLTAWEIVNRWSEKDIADVLFTFGEERFARRIARAVVTQREEKPIGKTLELVSVIESAVPISYRVRKIHCATKTFQALRIAVNDELNALSEGLSKGFKALSQGGRMAVISFHSLEDRIVKNFFRDRGKEKKGSVITKKPVVAEKKEREINPRSRSAKLRVFLKTI